MARGRGRRGGGNDPPAPSAPLWMLTYGDMITQILAFFILLYSFSSLNEQKFRETLFSLQGSFGVLPGSAAVRQGPRPVPSLGREASPVPTLEQLQAVYHRVQEALRAYSGGGNDNVPPDVEIDLDEARQQLVIRYRDQALFDSGKAEIKPEAIPRLDAVGQVLRQIPNRVRVEGHTDNVPIHNARYPSNWELSGARAMAVVRYLIEHHGIDPTRLEGSGRGEYWPIATNDTPEGRARNRRVDIIILSLDRSNVRGEGS